MAEPIIVTVRTLLAHFRSTLQSAQRTGEPVIIALRRRTPAGVLLGYETWQALVQGQPSDQASTSALLAELAAERQRCASLAAELAAARQRAVDLEAQLARLQLSAEVGATWRVTPVPAAPATSPQTGLSWGSTATPASSAPPTPPSAPILSGWGRS